MELISNGNVLQAAELIKVAFPKISGNTESLPHRIYFQLLCQWFIELIRQRNANGALEFAEAHLAPLANLSFEFAQDLQIVIALLAYADPESSAIKELLNPARRSELALHLNASILEEVESKLETNLKQLVTVNRLLSQLDPSTSTVIAKSQVKL